MATRRKPIKKHWLPYVDLLERRCVDEINLIVIHCTELPDLTMARAWGEKVRHTQSNTGNSGHFYIDRDGGVEEWVPLARIAHHVRDRNSDSIGIELVNRGRYPDWYYSTHQEMREPYPAQQIAALVNLMIYLQQQLPGITTVAGHADLDTGLLPSEDKPETLVRRKLDPGPCFPWHEVLKKTSLLRAETEAV